MRDYIEGGLAIFGALLLAFLAGQDAKADVFVEVGQAKYNHPDSGTWHQESYGYPAVFDDSDTALRIGWDQGVSKYLSIRASVFDLGRYATDSFSISDEACNVKWGHAAYQHCGNDGANFHTEGGVRGVAITAKATAYHLFVEAGPTWVWQRWKMSVNDHTYCNTTEGGMGYMAGAGVEYAGFTIAAYQYSSNAGSSYCQGDDTQSGWPSAVGVQRVWMAGYQFSF